MADDFPGTRILVIGICIAALGMVSNVLLLLRPLTRILMKSSLFDIWSVASLCILVLGLFVAFLGGVIFACTSEKPASVVAWGVAVALCAFLIVEGLDIDFRRPAAILLPVCWAAEFTGAFVLVIAAVRLAWRRVTHD